MKLSKAAKIWIDYHKSHSKKNSVRSYQAIIDRYIREFGDGPIDQVTPEHILTFLNRLTYSWCTIFGATMVPAARAQ